MTAEILTRTAVAILQLYGGECGSDLASLRRAMELTEPHELKAYDRTVLAESGNRFFSEDAIGTVTPVEANRTRSSLIAKMKTLLSADDILSLMQAAECVMEMSESVNIAI